VSQRPRIFRSNQLLCQQESRVEQAHLQLLGSCDYTHDLPISNASLIYADCPAQNPEAHAH
jgi:hypothetical protein